MNDYVRPNGPEIVKRRNALRWSQEDLVSKIGCGRRTLQRVEKSFRANRQTLEDVAQALECSVDDIVVRLSDDDAPETQPAHALLLPHRPVLCVGREAIIGELSTRIRADREQPVVVHGWPGVGKTTLAAVAVHSGSVTNGFTEGILWASLGEDPDIYRVLSTWCLAVDCAVPGPGETLADASARLRARLKDKKILLVVDDVWSAEQARHLLVADRMGAMIVTTRQLDIAQALTTSNDRIIKLDVLQEDDGLRILEHFVPDVVNDHPADSRSLVNALEGLPLALHVAGRLLRSEAGLAWGVDDLLRELRENDASLLQRHAPADATLSSTPQTVATLLNRSVKCLDDSTRDRYACLGAFAPKPATFELAALTGVWGVSEQEAKQTVRTLVGRGLLEPAGNEFQMHALLAALARGMVQE